MSVFFALVERILPLYFFILLGVIGGRLLAIDRRTLSALLFYVFGPILVFQSVATLRFEPVNLLIPAILYCMGAGLCGLFLLIGRRLWPAGDVTRNILAYTAGTSNTGYFGIPVVLALFGESAVGIAALSVIGLQLYENTVGFFVTARGRSSARESLAKLIRLPSIYAFALAVGFSAAGFQPGKALTETFAAVRGSYSLLGMLVIGLAISGRRPRWDARLIGSAFLAKFLVWPLLMAALVAVDQRVLHLYGDPIHRILLVLSCTPLAANTIVLATLLEAEPEKAALAVLGSTLFALLFIPLFVAFFL